MRPITFNKIKSEQVTKAESKIVQTTTTMVESKSSRYFAKPLFLSSQGQEHFFNSAETSEIKERNDFPCFTST